MRIKHVAVMTFAGAVLSIGGGNTVLASCVERYETTPVAVTGAQACALEGENYVPPNTGRRTWPAGVSTWHSSGAGFSSGSAAVYQDRVRWAGYGTYRETQIWFTRAEYLAAIGQYTTADVWFRQDDVDVPGGAYRHTWVQAGGQTSGSTVPVGAVVWVHQARSGGGDCQEWGGAYANAGPAGASVPVEQHSCPVEAPVAPNLP